jgi:hypothetical protein
VIETARLVTAPFHFFTVSPLLWGAGRSDATAQLGQQGEVFLWPKPSIESGLS